MDQAELRALFSPPNLDPAQESLCRSVETAWEEAVEALGYMNEEALGTSGRDVAALYEVLHTFSVVINKTCPPGRLAETAIHHVVAAAELARTLYLQVNTVDEETHATLTQGIELNLFTARLLAVKAIGTPTNPKHGSI